MCVCSLQDLADQYVSAINVLSCLYHLGCSWIQFWIGLTPSWTNHPLWCWQLVCFYYVLTTFTTVGYGEWWFDNTLALTLCFIPLQYVMINTVVYCRRYLCLDQRQAGEFLSSQYVTGCESDCFSRISSLPFRFAVDDLICFLENIL